MGSGIDDKECLASACDYSWTKRLWRSERCAKKMKYLCQYGMYYLFVRMAVCVECSRLVMLNIQCLKSFVLNQPTKDTKLSSWCLLL